MHTFVSIQFNCYILRNIYKGDVSITVAKNGRGYSATVVRSISSDRVIHPVCDHLPVNDC